WEGEGRGEGGPSQAMGPQLICPQPRSPPSGPSKAAAVTTQAFTASQFKVSRSPAPRSQPCPKTAPATPGSQLLQRRREPCPLTPTGRTKHEYSSCYVQSQLNRGGE